jgi:hypothetical protein
MNLQENIQRIREMMGIVTENIDDVLDKINAGERLSQEDRDKMSSYTKHLSSGGNENDFKYHRVSELNIAEPNSQEHINESQILVHYDHESKANPHYMVKKIGMVLSKDNIDSVVGYSFRLFTLANGYFVKVKEYQIEKAMSVLKDKGFSLEMNPMFNLSNNYDARGNQEEKFKNFDENPDIIISSDSEVYQNLNLSDRQYNDRLKKLLKKFGINNFFITKDKITITDKSKIDDLIGYLNTHGYNVTRS